MSLSVAALQLNLCSLTTGCVLYYQCVDEPVVTETIPKEVW